MKWPLLKLNRRAEFFYLLHFEGGFTLTVKKKCIFSVTKSGLITWVSVSLSELENSALSAMLRYCLSLNFFSKARSCWVVNGVLGFRFGLCFLRAQRTIGGPPLPKFGRFAGKKLKLIKLANNSIKYQKNLTLIGSLTD